MDFRRNFSNTDLAKTMRDHDGNGHMQFLEQGKQFLSRTMTGVPGTFVPGTKKSIPITYIIPVGWLSLICAGTNTVR